MTWFEHSRGHQAIINKMTTLSVNVHRMAFPSVFVPYLVDKYLRANPSDVDNM